MATHIPVVVTQEEFDPSPPSDSEFTMAQTNPTPSTTPKTNFQAITTAAKRCFVQRTLDGKVSTHHLTKTVKVRSHKRKSPSAKARSPASNGKTVKTKDDCKASRSLAITLHIEEVRNLMKRK
jgi:hypothetical protein